MGKIRSVYLPVSSLFGFQKLKKWDLAIQEYSKKHPHDIVFTLDRITSATHIRAGNGVHAIYLQKRTDNFLRRLSFKINPLHKTLLHLESAGFCSKKLCKLIVNSHMVKEEILLCYGVDPSKIQVCHNGVEYEEMSSPFAIWPTIKSEVEQELKLDPHLYTFLFAGHHYKRKGLDNLLRGFKKISDAQLLVVGQEGNPQRYRCLANTLGLSKRVHFLGERIDMLRIYSVADALVVPSLYDPFANVTIEALAMGLFVVTSPFNGGKEILDADSGCITEELSDSSSMASSLEKAMKFPKTTQRALVTRAKTASFDFSKKLAQIVELCLN